jgi:nonribosomal peptide synthetase DhbF
VELEGIIGFFVNTLALRIDLEGDPSFSALLARVRETAIGGFSNQELPFEKLVEEINPARHLSYPPLAQVLFVLQTAVGEGSLQLHGLTQEPVRGARLTTKFDLSLYAIEGPEGLRVSIEYGTDLFEEATVSRMLDQFRLLLESAVSDPSRPIGELDLVTPDEGARLLAQFAGNEVFPVGCLHELFEQRAAASPDSVAVSFEGITLSYDELNVRANKLAHLLRGAGVGNETLVALCLERSLDLVVAILAVLKAGGAYVPLDPSYPSDRLAFALEDTAATVLLTQERLIERLPDHRARVICLDRDADRIEEAPGTNLESVTTPKSAAYVIYTSGSTGRPKGVTVEHRNVARLLTATERWFDFRADDCWLLLHSYAFDFSVWELWGALLYGGRLVVVPHGTTRAPSLLRDLIVDERVTVLNATPSLFLAAMDELLSEADALALRVVVFGGEALQPSALRPWFARFGDGRPRLVNMYGITETTVHVTYRALAAGDGSREASPIGEPIPDLQVYVLDSRMRPVPEGVPGELFVGGAGVARGYLNRPELTAERFLANPHGDGMLYRSGDRARHHAGELFYLGRIDSQVKIRGFRIELGEIEAALRRQPGVRDALVAAREDESGDRRLYAYVAGDDPSPRVSELRDQLRLTLPDFMVPSAFVILDAFPLTPNGKVDRARLLAMNPSEEQREQAPARPRTPLEEQLVAIWGSVLGVEAIGVHDDFFELGGHSLLAVRLFGEMQRKLGVRLPLSALFEAATIAGIAELIERERREESEQSSIVRMRKGDRELPLFLVAWAGGEVLPYRDLVENLDARLPVIGLRAPGVDHRTTPLETVEGLAAHYVEEVQRVQPHGPYRLGGYCFSGLVAYEMARRLQAAGETIDSLVLIDSYPFQTPRRRSTFETGRVQVRAFREADRAGRREWVRNRAAGLRGRVDRLVYVTGGPRLFEALAARRLQRFLPRRPWNLVLIASNLARKRYVPNPLDVRLVFYRAQTEPHSRPTPWDDLATDGVELRQIVAPEIDHESMMHEPHVQLLAARLMLDVNVSGLADTSHTSQSGNSTADELSVASS